jgi:hypothetical protein
VGFLDEIASAPTGPTYGSLAAARALVEDLGEDEYALARVIASEYASGSPVELCAIGDADINKAAAEHRDLVDHITGGSMVYGSQGSDAGGGRKRPVSSARAPGPRHVRAALALLRGGFFQRLFAFGVPPARGIARGARRYFDPRAQLSSHRTNPGTHCHPLTILERWTFALPWGATRCSLGTTRGRDQEEWIGPLDGVNAYELMLMRPAGRQQQALYESARRVIESAGADQSGPSPARPLVELLVVVLIAAAAAALAGGKGAFV